MKKAAIVATAACLAWAVFSVPRGYTDDAPSEAGKKASAEKKAQTPPVKKTFRPRLPNYYGQIGLAEAQRKAIYGIQREYFHQIAKLEAQIAALEAERDKRIYNVLSPLQKKLLQQRLELAKKRREARRKKREQSQSDENEQ